MTCASYHHPCTQSQFSLQKRRGNEQSQHLNSLLPKQMYLLPKNYLFLVLSNNVSGTRNPIVISCTYHHVEGNIHLGNIFLYYFIFLGHLWTLIKLFYLILGHSIYYLLNSNDIIHSYVTDNWFRYFIFFRLILKEHN